MTCRNALIYFTKERAVEIVGELSKRVKMNGLLLLGHSDVLDVDWAALGFSSVGRCCYVRDRLARFVDHAAAPQILFPRQAL